MGTLQIGFESTSIFILGAKTTDLNYEGKIKFDKRSEHLPIEAIIKT
jgi:hypothetical protein